MAVTDTTSSIRYNGNGATVAFTFPFKVFANTDLKIYNISAAGVATLLTLTTDYTVVINTTTEGGTVTLVVATASGAQLFISRDLPNTQGNRFPREGNFPESSVEDALDAGVMRDIEIENVVKRAIKFATTSEQEDVILPEPEAGKIPGWGQTTPEEMENYENPTASAAAALASQVAAAASETAAAASETAAGASASAAAASAAAAASFATSSVQFVIDGGGSAITTGVKGDIRFPFACTITKVSVLADQSGSIVLDLWKDTYANYPPTVADTITASAKPTLSSATKAEDSTLTGWTKPIAAGSTLRVNVDSITTITRAVLVIEYQRT